MGWASRSVPCAVRHTSVVSVADVSNVTFQIGLQIPVAASKWDILALIKYLHLLPWKFMISFLEQVLNAYAF